MSEGKKSFALRISAELFEELRRWSAAEMRSVNGQIEYILAEAVRKRKGAAANDESESVDQGDSQ